MKVWEQTLGQKERWRHGEGNDGANKRDKGKDGVLQSKDHAKQYQVERKHTSRFSYCHKVFQVVPSLELHSLHKDLLFNLPLRTIKIW